MSGPKVLDYLQNMGMANGIATASAGTLCAEFFGGLWKKLKGNDDIEDHQIPYTVQSFCGVEVMSQQEARYNIKTGDAQPGNPDHNKLTLRNNPNVYTGSLKDPPAKRMSH